MSVLNELKKWIPIKIRLPEKVVIGKEETNFYVFYPPKEVEKVPQLIEKENFIVIREDLLPLFYRQLMVSNEDILERIRPYLSTKDYGAFLNAVSLIRAEDSKRSGEVEELYRKLWRDYSVRGRKIYNLLRSNKFAEYVMPRLEALEKMYNKTEEIAKGFQEFLNKTLEYMPYAIWVNPFMTVEDIVTQIRKRVIGDKVPLLCVYGRGTQIAKVKEACEKFFDELEENEKMKFARGSEEYEIGLTEGITYFIINTKLFDVTTGVSRL